MSRSGGSLRSGRALISTATSCSAQAANTRLASNCDSGRLPREPSTSRPVQCPSTFVAGSCTAFSMRRVMPMRSIRSLEWTLATTTSSRASISGVWSREPSSLMSTSMPLSRRKSSSASSTSATTSSCSASRSTLSPLATVRRGEWSVSTMYWWPRRWAVRAMTSIGDPPSDQSEWVCRSPSSCARTSSPPGESGPLPLAELGEVVGHITVEHLGMTSALGRRPGDRRQPVTTRREVVDDGDAAAALRNAWTR